MARQQYDQVLFNDVADQYIKGQDIIAYFTVLTSQQIDPNRDQIGLIRVLISLIFIHSFLSFHRLVVSILENV